MPVLPPPLANGIDFRLNVPVRQFRRWPTPTIRLVKHGIKPFGQQAVQQHPPLIRRKLSGQLQELIHRNWNSQRSHNKKSIASAPTAIKRGVPDAAVSR